MRPAHPAEPEAPPVVEHPPPLVGREVVVLLVALPEGEPQGAVAAARAALDPAERYRLDRMAHPRASAQFLLGRWLVRRALGAALGLRPGEVPLVIGPGGKPALAPGVGPLEFNLSHTAGAVALALCRAAPVGVDVEDLHRSVDDQAIARRFFSAAEAAALERTPPGARRAEFLRLWTLKEALAKARGARLPGALGDGRFARAGDGWTLEGTKAGGWWFAERRWRARFTVALAVGDGAPPPVRWCAWAAQLDCSV